MSKEYDTVFSLGEACFCATFLSKLRLRKFSAPFDWMYGATFDERFEILLDDFNNFIDKEDLSFVGRRDRPNPQDVYYDKRTGITFNHDFQYNGDFAKDYPKVREKYDKRIKRLLHYLEKGGHVLMVYMELPGSEQGVSSLEKLKELMAVISRKYANAEIDILYIKHDENMADHDFRCEQITSQITIGYCFNKDRISDVENSGNLENVRNLFSDITCKEQITDKYLYLLRCAVKKIIKVFYQKRIKNGEYYVRILGIKLVIRAAPSQR